MLSLLEGSSSFTIEECVALSLLIFLTSVPKRGECYDEFTDFLSC